MQDFSYLHSRFIDRLTPLIWEVKCTSKFLRIVAISTPIKHYQEFLSVK